MPAALPASAPGLGCAGRDGGGIKMVFRLLLGVAMLATSALPATAIAADVYIMRHLQKADASADPPLSDEGAARAQEVAELLEDRGIKAVFATDTQRAEQTGAPLAARLGIAVTTYDPRDPAALADSVKSAGGPVLVVGHSNTVPDLVAHFGGPRPPAMTEQDYGTIFVVDGTGGVTRIELAKAR